MQTIKHTRFHKYNRLNMEGKGSEEGHSAPPEPPVSKEGVLYQSILRSSWYGGCQPNLSNREGVRCWVQVQVPGSRGVGSNNLSGTLWKSKGEAKDH